MITPAAPRIALTSSAGSRVTATPAAARARPTAASIAGSMPPLSPVAVSRPAIRAAGAGGVVNPGSSSRIPSSTAATSAPRAPTVSSDGASGYTPLTEIRPYAVFSPVTPQQAAGMRTEPPVSVPNATSASPVATATADPEDDPPGSRRGSRGLVGVPDQWLTPLADQHSSVSPVLPTIRAPAPRAAAAPPRAS